MVVIGQYSKQKRSLVCYLGQQATQVFLARVQPALLTPKPKELSSAPEIMRTSTGSTPLSRHRDPCICRRVLLGELGSRFWLKSCEGAPQSLDQPGLAAWEPPPLVGQADVPSRVSEEGVAGGVSAELGAGSGWASGVCSRWHSRSRLSTPMPGLTTD